MFDCALALMTGVDFPVSALNLIIHQPTIKEISMVGEQDFFMGVQVLCVDKKQYTQDPLVLTQFTNFDIFMSIINEKEAFDKKYASLQVLTLLFPQYKIDFLPRSILLRQDEENIIIDEGNFEFLQRVVSEIFCLKKEEKETFNPQSSKAKEIAQKLMQARKKVAEQKISEHSGSTLGLYLSVLSIGCSMSLDQVIQLTMYQLYDLIERYHLYISWDIDIRSRMAGAKGDKPIENWMKQIH